MNNKDLYTLSNLFEKEAQNALPNDKSKIQHPVDLLKVLAHARMLPIALSLLTPVLNQAKVKNETNVKIRLIVNPGPVVSFSTLLDPNDGEERVQRVNTLLKQRFGKAIEDAIRNSGAVLDKEQSIPWMDLSFKRATPLI